MPNTLLLKRSTTAAAVPNAAQLAIGELAVNVADARLFTKKSNGSVVNVGQDFASVLITGGSINGTPIGATTPSTGKFSTVQATATTAATSPTLGAIVSAGGIATNDKFMAPALSTGEPGVATYCFGSTNTGVGGYYNGIGFRTGGTVYAAVSSNGFYSYSTSYLAGRTKIGNFSGAPTAWLHVLPNGVADVGIRVEAPASYTGNFFEARNSALALLTSISSTGAFTAPSLQMGSTGTPLLKLLSAIATLDFPSIAAQSFSDLTLTVTGAAVNDLVQLGLPASPASGINFQAFVSAANTITVRAQNATGLAIDPASASYRVSVMGF
jgi:hypothetical protein